MKFNRIMIVGMVGMLIAGCTNTDMPATVSPNSETTQRDVAPAPTIPSTEGVWKMKSASMAGTSMPSAATDSITLKLSANNYEVTVGNSPDKGT